MWVHLRQRFLDLQHGGESLALPALLLRAHRPGVGAGRWPWKKGSQHGEERICRGGIELRSQRHAPPSSAGCEAVRAAPHLALAQALRLHAVRCAGVSPAHHRQRSARAGGGQEDGALRPLRPLLSIPGKGAGLGAPPHASKQTRTATSWSVSSRRTTSTDHSGTLRSARAGWAPRWSAVGGARHTHRSSWTRSRSAMRREAAATSAHGSAGAECCSSVPVAPAGLPPKVAGRGAGSTLARCWMSHQIPPEVLLLLLFWRSA